MLPPWLLAITTKHPPTPGRCTICNGTGRVKAWIWELVQVTKKRVRGSLDSKTAFKRVRGERMCTACMGDGEIRA